MAHQAPKPWLAYSEWWTLLWPGSPWTHATGNTERETMCINLRLPALGYTLSALRAWPKREAPH